MIPVFLAEHLLQSTVFTIVAALLAWVLRKNRARTRYWLWLIASVKFLIPFSILVALGSHVSWPRARVPEHQLSLVITQMNGPFWQAQGPARSAALTRTTTPVVPALNAEWPALLFTLWMAGFLVVVCSWWLRWLGIHTTLREANPAVLNADVPVFSTSSWLEPGIVGVFRPVLVLPQGITQHLTAPQLEAVVAHEMCHVRHRDNLAAAVHMIVEAIFWFHPLVWWLGARLVEERERACDEEVLRLGSKPEVYAESILKTCEFYLKSPLVCMSGVTGGSLKNSVVRIMTERVSNQLGIGKKLMLAAAGIVVIGGPVAAGSWTRQDPVRQTARMTFDVASIKLIDPVQLGELVRPLPGDQSYIAAHAPVENIAQAPVPQAARLTFDVASIKLSDPNARGGGIRPLPGGQSYVATGVPIKLVMKLMYKLTDSQISGGPSWFENERYDIRANAEHPCNIDQLHEMFQSLLAERFKLQFHKETRELSAYVMTVDKAGSKMKVNDSAQDFEIPIQGTAFGKVTGKRVPMNYLTWFLAQNLRRPVVDKTGLDKNYDFTLEWAPEIPAGAIVNPGAPPPPAIDGPTLFTALREQLGLKLSSEKGPVEVFVIDHVERPSDN